MSTSEPPSQEIETDNYDDQPLLKYVTKEKMGRGGGNANYKCTLCSHTWVGSYSRVRGHLLKIKGEGVSACKSNDKQKLALFKRLDEAAKLREQNKRPKDVSLPNTNVFYQEGIQSKISKKRKGATSTSNPVVKAFDAQARQEADAEIARMFYSGGMPFHYARNPHYSRSYTLVSNLKPGYIPPSYNALRTTLLQNERRHIEKLLEPSKLTWKEKGVSIVSDGWTDAQRRPIINFMAASSCGPMFIKAINCEGEKKDKEFIRDLIVDVIKEVGPENVVQVITDNAPVCKAAGLLVQSIYPQIFWTPCVVHTLNLALRNICAAKNTEANEETYEECKWISRVLDGAFSIKNFIVNHQMRLAIYNEHVDLKMLSIAETRFASSIVMLKRFKQVKRGLQNMVISEQWNSYRDDDFEKAQDVRRVILDEEWWGKVDYILEFTMPIYEMLRAADTDKPSLHLVYEMWDSMIEKVKVSIYTKEDSVDYNVERLFKVVERILINRWSKSNTPLHCLAHALNPRFYSNQYLEGGLDRVSPSSDVEITNLRKKCFEKFFPNPEERRRANMEYADFSGHLNDFEDGDSIMDRFSMEPVAWWIVHGASTPLLQKLALKLLGQPTSSSCCERNWSTYSFIQCLKRNKITPQRAEDLVFVHTNLRLLSRRSPQYKQGKNKLWDIGGDSFDPLQGAGELEIANLSLDEPEFESTYFVDGDEGTEGLDFVPPSSGCINFGRFEIALLCLGMMHIHFGHPKQALEVLTEAVRVSQQNSDDTCLAYTLTAICNLLSEIGISCTRGILGSSYSPVISIGTSLSVQQQLFVLLRGSLKRAETLKLKRLIASHHLSMAKFDLTHVQRPLLSFGPKACTKLTTCPANVCKEMRLSSHLISEFGTESSITIADGTFSTAWLKNLQKPTGSLVLSDECGFENNSDASHFCAQPTSIPKSVLQLVGSSYLLRTTAWELYGSAPLARINALVYATCFADASSSADVALAYAKLIQHLAVFSGYKEAFAALKIAEEKFLSISKSRIQTVKLQLLHERALHRGHLKLAQQVCDELGVLASSVTGVDMELKTEASLRHARTLLAANQFSQAASVAHSLFCMCYKFNLQVENASVLLLLAEIHKKSGNGVLGLPYALASLSFCQSFNLDLLKASATLTLAELWLSLGSNHARRALSLIHGAFPMILGHGGLEIRARAFIAEAKCYLADPTFSVIEDPETVLDPLRQASDELQVLEYHELAAEAFYLMAIVYDKLGMLDEREEAAASFKFHLTALENPQDEEDPLFNML